MKEGKKKKEQHGVFRERDMKGEKKRFEAVSES